MTPRVEPEYVTCAEAEIISGRSRWTWRKDAYSRRVASCKVGRRLLLPLAEVRRVMTEGLRPRVEAESR